MTEPSKHTEPTSTPPVTSKSGLPGWLKRTIGALVLVVVLIITYFILAAFIPRWWGQRIGKLAAGSFASGTSWGLFYGAVCTLVPLVLLLLAVLVWRTRRVGRVIGSLSALAAVVVAVPNLMTLTVVLGENNAAHAGQRIMDVDAPGFRGASLIGAIVAVAIFLLVAFLVVKYRRRGRQLKAAPVETNT